jgi:hypothetical protein
MGFGVLEEDKEEEEQPTVAAAARADRAQLCECGFRLVG